MKIHWILLSVLTAFIWIFSTALSFYLDVHPAFIIAIGLFGVICLLATLVLNAEMPSNQEYYHFNFPFKKNKKKEDIKEVLLEKMRTAEGQELDKLIEKIENL